MNRKAFGVDAMFDTMLGVYAGDVRPCDLGKVGKEVVVLVSWLEMVLRWSVGAPASQSREKICFSFH